MPRFPNSSYTRPTYLMETDDQPSPLRMYKHEPLTDPTKQTRLMKLDRITRYVSNTADMTQPIHPVPLSLSDPAGSALPTSAWQLESFDLDKAPRYNALSYTWSSRILRILYPARILPSIGTRRANKPSSMANRSPSDQIYMRF